METLRQGPPLLGYGLAGLIIVIWTGFLVVSRLGGTGGLTPYDVTAIRLGTAAVLVLPLWLRGGRQRLWEPRMLALTLCGGLGYTLFTYSGFRLAPAAHAGVLLSGLQPFLIAWCAWAVMGERPTAQRWAGMAVIAAGALTLGYGVFSGGLATWAATRCSLPAPPAGRSIPCWRATGASGRGR